MTVYVYRCGLGVVPREEAARRAPVFHYWSDIPPYKSPLGTGEISSRTHRREELKRHDCREVEPSEAGSFAKRHAESRRALMEADAPYTRSSPYVR